MANEVRKFLDDTGTALVWAKVKEQLALKADIASPTFTGAPKSVTPTTGDNSENIATTAFVKTAIDNAALTIDDALSTTSTNPVQNKVVTGAINNKAPLASPALTGTPTAPTATAGTNNTQVATTAFVTTAITNAIAGITQIHFEIVSSLPATGDEGTIYLVSNSGTGTNVYDEYIYVNDNWEKIGTTDIDLSPYMLKTDMVAITSAEIDTICV